MPEDKGLGSKLLGLFVERDPGTPAEGSEAVEPGEKSPADLVAELAGQSTPKRAPGAPAVAPPPAARPAMPSPSGPVTPANVDFDGVFKQAGIDSGDLDRVRKAEELLKSLPEATPVEVKRQIVEASLKAFGFDLAKIVNAANTQLKALDTYVRLNEQQTVKSITDAQAKIAQLEEQIIGLRADINKRTEALASTSAAAENRKAQVHQVLSFFNAPKPA
jgi:ABC-type transporter Mla subunit MlaD